ncbi:MAG: sugar phosphate nucleotidyltransferase [Anaerolineae bacterium]
MTVIILCGGKGTRMTGSGYEAKALVEVGDRPIIWHIMKIYAHYGLSDFVLTLGHGAAAIKQYFLDYGPMTQDFTICLGERPEISYHAPHDAASWEIALVDTGLETNKGGRVRRVLDHIQGEHFHLTYGDGLGDVDLHALTHFHIEHGRLATITGYQPHSQYGIVQVEADGRITGYEEKPLLADWINAGFMLLRREAVEYFMRGDDDLDLEQDILGQLAAEGELMMYRHTGFWRSMDSFKEAKEMDQLWSTGAPWKVWA